MTEARPISYYDHANQALLEQIPLTARTILDVGCGTGALGAALKCRQECDVVGVEIDQAAAEAAERDLDQVYCCDVADPDVDEIFLPVTDYFDVIVMGDVLEHLDDPLPVLEMLARKLAPGGVLVLSVPNVAHWSVLQGLLRGEWEYSDAGLLDRDHKRFYTLRSVERLLREAGFTPRVKMRVELASPVPEEVIQRLQETGLAGRDFAAESQVYQYIITATREEAGEHLTSIIILCHNVWEQTRSCLASIAAYTPEPFEVIVVDNASTDETPEMLAAMAAENNLLTVITNTENRPFAAANNQALAIARGDTVLLLNNDTVVTHGWLRRMQEILDEHPTCGIVGPMSNYVAGQQKVLNVGYEDSAGMQEFAANWSAAHQGEMIETAGVIGFCMLVRRELFDSIGVLDERFVNGYEETDFCYRAVQAGYHCRIARDVFVHHSGSQTFIETGSDPKERDSRYWQLIEENWGRFREKWNIPEDMSANEGLGWLIRKLEPGSERPHVYWAALMERSVMWQGVAALLDIAEVAGALGYRRIPIPYTATDVARNQAVRKFMQVSRHPDDVLVMLDCDHAHPEDTLRKLAAHPFGVVGVLAFRRRPPFDPQFYVRDQDGELQQPAELDEVVYEGDLVGSAAIAIKRWVFDRLADQGHEWPHFRYEYRQGALNRPGEEIYFARICEEAGIHHYCDATFQTPHWTVQAVGRTTWASYRRKHPEFVNDLEEEGK